MSKNTPAAVDAAPHRINPRSVEPDARLLSTPDTILWGYIAANLPLALTIEPGQIVEIEALSHPGSHKQQRSVDLGIGEAVDIVNLVYANVSENIFPSNPPYSFTPGGE